MLADTLFGTPGRGAARGLSLFEGSSSGSVGWWALSKKTSSLFSAGWLGWAGLGIGRIQLCRAATPNEAGETGLAGWLNPQLGWCSLNRHKTHKRSSTEFRTTGQEVGWPVRSAPTGHGVMEGGVVLCRE
ncbi:hypothetical protein LX32DRAFT_13241 [Colletotrichum zoysiae]|uniref:Uncharacterized protein n=1 Tax=Colletotrichum zoysiae TaxID=1216348 RepID=A0AAD9LZG0_9PEZI|nr:hypothetical protein LX32DRAFT_13241 [Colletotrichum zoysiae]